MITKYHNLGLDELLALADSKGAHSPIITELARRLTEGEIHDKDASTSLECPCCEAALEIEYDDANGIYNLKVEK